MLFTWLSSSGGTLGYGPPTDRSLGEVIEEGRLDKGLRLGLGFYIRLTRNIYDCWAVVEFEHADATRGVGEQNHEVPDER